MWIGPDSQGTEIALQIHDKGSGSASEAGRLLTRQRLLLAGGLFFVAVALFVATDALFHIDILHPSATPYYIYQASSWLQGRWDIWPVPGPKPIPYLGGRVFPSPDLVVVGGRAYSIYGPFPAFLALPFVAVFGPNLSDTLLNLIYSALNLSLIFLLFEQLRLSGLTHRSWRENLAWSIVLYIGSTAFFLSLGGEVWFTGNIVTAGCVVLSLLLAFRRRFVWSSVALAAGILTRDDLILAFPFLIYLAWELGSTGAFVGFVSSVRARRPNWLLVPWARLLKMSAVMVITVGLYAVRNVAMFGNPLESGYDILLTQDYHARYGLLSIHYLKANLANSFFAFPHVVMAYHFDIAPSIDMLGLATGTSVFFTTPLFLFLFWRNRTRSQLRIALWVTIVAISAFVLLYFTAGFPEFGTRYLFDVYPFAWVLLLLGEVKFDWRVTTLGIFAIIVNFLGAYQLWTGHMIHLGRLPF